MVIRSLYKQEYRCAGWNWQSDTPQKDFSADYSKPKQ